MVSRPAGRDDPTIRQLAVVLGLVGAVVWALVSLSIGVAAGSGFAGGGWRLPPANVTWVGRVVSGKPTGHWFTGFPAPTPRPDHAWLVWLIAVLVFCAGAALTVWATLWLRRFAGHDSRRGMAGPGEIDKALGRSRLEDSAPLVRPDIYQHRRPVIPRNHPRRDDDAGWGEQPTRPIDPTEPW